LLSHRKAWHYIVKHSANDEVHTLVLESDSVINFPPHEFDASLLQTFDLFFWGAWEGHAQLFQSTQKNLDHGFIIGEPFIKSVYCTYGYSLNKKAAALLLKRTAKICYPVDQFKKFIQQDSLRLGAVKPEMISSNNIASSIHSRDLNNWQRRFYLAILDIKNKLICSFR